MSILSFPPLPPYPALCVCVCGGVPQLALQGKDTQLSFVRQQEGHPQGTSRVSEQVYGHPSFLSEK